jgi:hypothetical protein
MKVFETGTKTFFCQTSAPTGWTKNTSIDDHAIRVVNGSTGGSISGSVNFSTCFTPYSWTGTTSTQAATGPTILSKTQIPNHTHGGTAYQYPMAPKFSTAGYYPASPVPYITRSSGSLNWGTSISPAGGGLGHDHPIVISTQSTSITPTDFSVKYVDCILCTAS